MLWSPEGLIVIVVRGLHDEFDQARAFFFVGDA